MRKASFVLAFSPDKSLVNQQPFMSHVKTDSVQVTNTLLRISPRLSMILGPKLYRLPVGVRV